MRLDHNASESILGPIVFGITAIGVCLILVSQVNLLGALGESSRQSDLPSGYDIIGGWEYDVWDPTGGYYCNGSRISNHYPDHTIDDPLEIYLSGGMYWAEMASFWNDDRGIAEGDRDEVNVFVIENNTILSPGSGDIARVYEDFIWIEQNTGNWWGEKWRRAAISYDEVYSNIEENESVINFMLGKLNLTLVISSSADFYYNFTVARNYTIRIATVWGESNVGSTSMWSMVGRLLTGQWPSVEWPWSMMLALPFWAMITVIAITLISRFIPLIPGG